MRRLAFRHLHPVDAVFVVAHVLDRVHGKQRRTAAFRIPRVWQKLVLLRLRVVLVRAPPGGA